MQMDISNSFWISQIKEEETKKPNTKIEIK